MKIITLAAAAAAGAVFGAIYFFSIQWSVRRMSGRKRPGRWMAGNAVLRFMLAAGFFYLLISTGRWELIMSALAGFILVRILMVRPGANPEIRKERMYGN